jgi:hypothetical protein
MVKKAESLVRVEEKSNERKKSTYWNPYSGIGSFGLCWNCGTFAFRFKVDA